MFEWLDKATDRVMDKYAWLFVKLLLIVLMVLVMLLPFMAILRSAV